MAGDRSGYELSSLRQRLPGVAVTLLGRTASTQQHAIDMLERGDASPPAMVVADEQTHGRGRGLNRWQSDAGSVTATFLIPATKDQTLLELPLRCGLAVRSALGSWIDPARVKIKWPNDVLVDGLKIAGVLCQQVRGVNVVGIGLNVSMDFNVVADAPSVDAPAAALAGRATSLGAHLKEGVPLPGRQQVLVELARAVLSLWETADWHARLLQHHALTGREIVVETSDGPLAGLCEGIDPQGRLLVRTGQRIHALYDGSIVKTNFIEARDEPPDETC